MALSLLGANDPFSSDPFFSQLAPVFSQLGGLSPDDVQLIRRAIPIDLRETDKEYVITADVPGVDRGDVRVTVDGDVLQIAVEGERAKEEDDGGRYHRVERTQIYSSRRIRLPDSADLSAIQAKLEPNGVLRVNVPKKSGSTGQQSIDVQ